ncbi:MAG: DUF433 domain-containing protein [Thermomicrobiales bacterium]
MTKEQSLYQDRIVQDPAIMVGKPVIRGTRIPVERIIAHLATTPDLDDLFAAYPRLTIEDVQAALAYAHDAVSARSRRARRKSSVERVPVPA